MPNRWAQPASLLLPRRNNVKSNKRFSFYCGIWSYATNSFIFVKIKSGKIFLYYINKQFLFCLPKKEEIRNNWATDLSFHFVRINCWNRPFYGALLRSSVPFWMHSMQLARITFNMYVEYSNRNQKVSLRSLEPYHSPKSPQSDAFSSTIITLNNSQWFRQNFHNSDLFW